MNSQQLGKSFNPIHWMLQSMIPFKVFPYPFANQNNHQTNKTNKSQTSD